jgi:hypothetical protein
MFSYLDLYLMGMVSPAEADAGLNELRYMDDSVDCSSPYAGAISDFTMADIVAAAGPRVPDSGASQKDFKTAWVIIHQPGDPPDDAEKQKLIDMLEQQQLDWSYSTLGRSTMSHKLDPVVWTDLGYALAGAHGDPLFAGSGPLTTGSAGSLTLSNAAGPGALSILFTSLASTPTTFKGGTLATVPILLQLTLVTAGNPGGIPLPWPSWPGGLSGLSLYFQYAIEDAAAVQGVALSNVLRADVP